MTSHCDIAGRDVALCRRVAVERLGDKAILNFLPDGRLNPSRLALRLSATRSSIFKGEYLILRTRLILFYIKRHFHKKYDLSAGGTWSRV
jgi:hypothetical protein